MEEGSSTIHSPIILRVNYDFLLVVHPLQLSVKSALLTQQNPEPGDFLKCCLLSWTVLFFLLFLRSAESKQILFSASCEVCAIGVEGQEKNAETSPPRIPPKTKAQMKVLYRILCSTSCWIYKLLDFTDTVGPVGLQHSMLYYFSVIVACSLHTNK